MAKVPVFINSRDQLSALRELVGWLEHAGCEDIYFLDNASTYPPLLDYYSKTPHNVLELGHNLGYQALWRAGVLDKVGVGGPFVLTDPDIVPIEECPLDAIDFLADVLERYPGTVKVGFNLRIDDIPDHFEFKHEVIASQSRHWRRKLAPGLYRSAIDTTFALYPAGSGFERAPAIRTDYPYLARHSTWYVNSDDPDEEQLFYRAHAHPDCTNWTRDELPKRILERVKEER